MIPACMAGGTGKVALPSARMEKAESEVGFGGKIRCSIVGLSLRC